jgi:hypothetical protein
LPLELKCLPQDDRQLPGRSTQILRLTPMRRRVIEKAADVLLFSNEAGEEIRYFETAWKAAILRAHGVEHVDRKRPSHQIGPEVGAGGPGA